MENLPQNPSQPVQQPWAHTVPMGAHSLINHPWAMSPHAQTAPIFSVPGRIRGKLSTYREGWMCMVPEGFLLSGKAVDTTGAGNVLKQVGIYFLLGSLLGSIVAESALKKLRQDALPWDCVEEIVLNSAKGRLCIVYHLPDAPTKPLSLGLRLSPAPLFQQFVHVATHYLGAEKVHEGKIGSPTPPVKTAIALVIVFALIIGVMLLFASSNPH